MNEQHTEKSTMKKTPDPPGKETLRPEVKQKMEKNELGYCA